MHVESDVSELGQTHAAYVCASESHTQTREPTAAVFLDVLLLPMWHFSVPPYYMTFGAVGACAVVGGCMAHVLSPVVRCVDLRWRLCLAMISVGTR